MKIFSQGGSTSEESVFVMFFTRELVDIAGAMPCRRIPHTRHALFRTNLLAESG